MPHRSKFFSIDRDGKISNIIRIIGNCRITEITNNKFSAVWVSKNGDDGDYPISVMAGSIWNKKTQNVPAPTLVGTTEQGEKA